MEVPQKIKNRTTRDFPGGPVVKTLCFHYREPGFDPLSGTFRMPRGAGKKQNNTTISFGVPSVSAHETPVSCMSIAQCGDYKHHGA